MKTKWIHIFLISLTMLTWTSTVTAEEQEKEPDTWQFGVAPYAWFTTIKGDMNMGLPGLNISPDDLLSNLELGALISLEARRKRWLVMTDIVYLKASGSETLRDGPFASRHANLDVESWVVDMYGGYNAVKSDWLILDAVIGLRYFSMANDLSIKGTGGIVDINVSDTVELLNGVVGVRGAVLLGKGWFLPYHLDAGAGDAKFTWQGMAGVGYSFDWIELIAAYRYMSFESDNNKVDSLTMGGPLLGIKFVF
jgi:opacity protein-like surface antigen